MNELNFRTARFCDVQSLLDLIATGFAALPDGITDPQKGQQHRVLFSYLYNQDPTKLQRVILAEQAGRLGAAAGWIPQSLSCGGVILPVGAISPVVSHPDFQGQNLAGACLGQLLSNLKQQELPLVYLWGLPKYYPRFGFVPLLPRYKTRVSQALLQKFPPLSGFKLWRFNNTKNDIAALSELYNQRQSELWLQPQRSLAWWQARIRELGIAQAELKEVPFPKKENLLLGENISGEVTGYLYFTAEPQRQRVTLEEAAVSDPESARGLLLQFMATYLPAGQTLYIRGTPEHYLNAAALQLGGVQLTPEPLAGMIKVLDWPRLLTSIRPLLEQRIQQAGLAGRAFKLQFQDWLRIEHKPDSGVQLQFIDPPPELDLATNAALTRVVFGLSEAQRDLTGFTADPELVQVVFPRKYPFIWDANYLY